MSDVAYIYAIRNTANGKVYVGSTCCIRYRWGTHKSDLRYARHCNAILQKAWDKYGEAAFTFEILEECNSESRFEREGHWIVQLRSTARDAGYNLQIKPAGGRLGLPHSEDSKQRMRVAARGRTATPEARQRMSEAHRGKKQSPELIAKRASALRGRHVTPETRARISESNRGKHHTMSVEGRRQLLARNYSPANLARLKTANRNRVHSEETRRKMSASHKARHCLA